MIEIRENKLSPSGTAFTEVTTMDHDLWGRMINKSERGKVISFQYDNRSNRTRVSTGNGTSTYVHDSKNLLQSVSTDGQTTGYEYYPNGRVKTETHPNGTQNTYTYDPAGQTLSIITQKGTDTLVSYTYEYDRNGNRSRQVEFQKGLVGKENLMTTYIHDSQDRLTGYTEGNRTISYTYDGAHNRLTEKVEVGGMVTENWAYAYDRHNRLLEKRSAITNAAELNQYDANGNRTRLTKPGVTQEFLFDSRDVMSLSKEGNTLLGMNDYNFDGMRVRHEGSDRGDVSSFYDGINVLEESIGSDALRYAYGLDTAPISLKSAGGFEYYHQATLGTTTALTDAGGKIKASYRTGPWGDVGEQSGSSQNRMIFTSQEHDPNTGLVYFGARYYEPGVGRFVTQDSWFMETPDRCFKRPMECALYSYATSRPLVYMDLSGNWATDAHNFLLNESFSGLRGHKFLRLIEEGSASVDGDYATEWWGRLTYPGYLFGWLWNLGHQQLTVGSSHLHALADVHSYSVTTQYVGFQDGIVVEKETGDAGFASGFLKSAFQDTRRTKLLGPKDEVIFESNGAYLKNSRLVKAQVYFSPMVYDDSTIAKNKYDEYIHQKIKLIKDLLSKCRYDEAAREIGIALHTITDSTSPAHNSPPFKPWDIVNDLPNHGISSTSKETAESATNYAVITKLEIDRFMKNFGVMGLKGLVPTLRDSEG